MLKIIQYILAILLVSILLFSVAFEHDWVELKTVDGEQVLLAPLPKNSKFCIRFTHSVALSPVDECFVADAGDVVLKSTIYHDFGAGLPHSPEAGQEMIFKDGKIIINGYSLRIPVLQVRVGRIAKHILMLPSIFTHKLSQIPLESFVKPGGTIKISIKKYSIIGAYIKNWSAIYIKF